MGERGRERERERESPDENPTMIYLSCEAVNRFQKFIIKYFVSIVHEKRGLMQLSSKKC